MSATKLDTSGVFSDSPESGQETLLSLPSNSFHVSKNGIEFQTAKPIADWTEMTVELEGPKGGKSVKCTGIVVGCNGSKATGYSVSMVFMNLTPGAEASLAQLSAG